MKIGVILPIGDLGKYGYQYNSDLIIDNLEKFADELLIVSSTRNNKPDLFRDRPKIKYLSNEDVWFKLDDDKREIFSYKTMVDDMNIALRIMKADGMDAVIQIHINQFISEDSSVGLRESIRKMLEGGRHYEWLYKKYQCGKLLFDADTRVPWILNLQIKNPFLYSTDSIVNPETDECVRIEDGDFYKYNSRAITDSFGEFTVKDGEDIYNLTQLEKIRLTRKSSDKGIPFSYGSWFKYYMNKFNYKIISKESMDVTGLEILQRRRNDFFSFEIEKKYKPLRPVLLAKRILRLFA